MAAHAGLVSWTITVWRDRGEQESPLVDGSELPSQGDRGRPPIVGTGPPALEHPPSLVRLQRGRVRPAKERQVNRLAPQHRRIGVAKLLPRLGKMKRAERSAFLRRHVKVVYLSVYLGTILLCCGVGMIVGYEKHSVASGFGSAVVFAFLALVIVVISLSHLRGQRGP